MTEKIKMKDQARSNVFPGLREGRWRIDPKRNKAAEHSTRRPVIVALRGG
jgi:hypothetical protein